MFGHTLSLQAAIGIGVPTVLAHLAAVTLAHALRTYSRSRLESVCAARGRPQRAEEIEREDQRAERAAGALAVVTGLGLAALLGATAGSLIPGMALEAVLTIALVIGAAGYMLAGLVGRIFAESFLDAVWPAVGTIRAVTWPLTSIAGAIEQLVSRIIAQDDTLPRPASFEVEIPGSSSDAADEADAELPESTRRLLHNAVELSQTDVAALMTPRAAIVSLPADSPARAAARVFRETGLSRIPLYGENRDDVVGILYAKDLYPLLTDHEDPDTIVVRTIARPAFCVPETKNARELLEEFRRRRTQIAIVVDEYGGVAGLATLEDLLEALVGAIDDEHDKPTPEDPVVALDETRYEVDAAVEIEQLNERLNLHLPTDADFSSIGGFAFHELGRLPDPGATFQHNGVGFTVVAVGDHSIKRIRIDLEPGSIAEPT